MIKGENNMTRIRYKRINGLLTSPQFLAINQLVDVTIDETKSEAQIHSNEGHVIKELKATNLQNLKKLIKKTLIEMGVNFQPEVRPRFETGTGHIVLPNKDFDRLAEELIEEDGDDFI